MWLLECLAGRRNRIGNGRSNASKKRRRHTRNWLRCDESMAAVSVARAPRARGELGLGAEMTKGTAETKHGILLKNARHTAETHMYEKAILCSLMVEKVFYK